MCIENQINNNRVSIPPSDEVAAMINKILKKYGIDTELPPEYVKITRYPSQDETQKLSYYDGYLVINNENIDPQKTLSGIVKNHIWPSITDQKPIKVLHFTTKKKAKKIQSTQKINLTHIFKRLNENEIEPFKRKFNFCIDSEKISKKVFYMSFYSGPRDSLSLYKMKSFGDFVIEFELTPNKDIIDHEDYLDCRDIIYDKSEENKRLFLLHDIQNQLREKFNCEFVMHGTTRMGCFYLPSFFKHENEVRVAQFLFDCLPNQNDQKSIKLNSKHPGLKIQFIKSGPISEFY